MVETIMKRDGRTVEFKQEKIAEAVERAFQACGAMQDRAAAEDIAQRVVDKLESGAIEGAPTVEGVQDLVEETLIESGFVQTAKSYILYRAERSRSRDVNSRLIQTLKDITFSKASDSDMKRENANIDADTAMGTMLKYGSESAKQFYEMCVIDPKFARAHREGDIHIHDMDFYTLTTTCCQIELKKLFKSGFSTGHGVLREPNDIASYAALACIAIQSNQNDQHGGQAICDFDYGLAEGVRKTYRRLYKKHLAEAVDLLLGDSVDDSRAFAQDALARIEAERAMLASSLPADLLDAYKKTAARTGGVAVGRLQGSNCGVCRMAIEGGRLIDMNGPGQRGSVPSVRKAAHPGVGDTARALLAPIERTTKSPRERAFQCRLVGRASSAGGRAMRARPCRPSCTSCRRWPCGRDPLCP